MKALFMDKLICVFVEEFAETLKERETRKIWMSIILK
jgi:hypothetical protein